MLGRRFLLFAVIIISSPAVASQGQSDRNDSTQRQASDWTTPGWYVVEYQSDGSRDAIRSGPFQDRSTCASFRRREFFTVPRGHPELDTLGCRQLLSRPH